MTVELLITKFKSATHAYIWLFLWLCVFFGFWVWKNKDKNSWSFCWSGAGFVSSMCFWCVLLAQVLK